MKVYHKIFGSHSPYANIIDGLTNPPPLYTNKDAGIGTRTKDTPVEKIVRLDLEEVYTGCVKLMQVWRQEFIDAEETRMEKRKKILTLNIEPGVTEGTRYCFKEEGDRSPTKIPADIIFIIENNPHKMFQRKNLHDLLYIHEIDLCRALTGFQFVINTLDKRKLNISINDVVKPGYRKIIPGEGLPKCKEKEPPEFHNFDKGDLIIEFKSKLN